MKILAETFKPVLPKEHGVMVIALIPLLTSIAISLPCLGRSAAPAAWFCAAVVFLLMGFSPFTMLLKRWSKGNGVTTLDRNLLWAGIYLFLSLASFLYLLSSTGLWGLLLFLLPISAVFFYYCHLLVNRRNRDNLTMNILGAVALCLVAPMAYYICRGRLDANALMLYIVNLGYFSSRIIFAGQMINLKEDDAVLSNFKSRRKYFRKVSLLNVGIIHVLVICSILKLIPSTAVTSLLPGSIYTWKQIFSLKQKPNVRSVGLKEMCVSFCFSAILIYAYRSW